MREFGGNGNSLIVNCDGCTTLYLQWVNFTVLKLYLDKAVKKSGDFVQLYVNKLENPDKMNNF